MVEKEITLEMKKPEVLVLLAFLAIVFVLETQVTISTPISFGDEGFHTRMAQWMGEGLEYPVWNPFEGSDLTRGSFHRPPLWNLLEGSMIFLLGYSEFFIKLFTPMIVFISGIAIFTLVKKLYNERIALISAIISIAVPSYVTYSVVFYTDILFALYFTLFSLTLVLSIKTNNKKYWIVSPLFASLAFLTKMPGLAVFPVIFMAFVYQVVKKKDFMSLFKKYALFVGIMAIVCSGYIVRNIYYYNTPYAGVSTPFFEEKYTIGTYDGEYDFEGRTENSGTELGPLEYGITSYLEFAYGSLWFVVFGCLAGIFLFLIRRKETDVLIMIVLVAIAFIFMQSLDRVEDTARHTLGWVSIIAIIVANYFDHIYTSAKKYLKKFGIIAMVVFVIVLFVSYQTLESKLGTMSQVKKFSSSFFEACGWIKDNLAEDSLIFTVWSHRAAYNCQRSVIGNMADISVSNDVDHIIETAEEHRITHIFIQKFSIDYYNQHLQESYDLEFVQLLENNPDYFENVYEDGMTLDTCISQGGCDGSIIYEIIY